MDIRKRVGYTFSPPDGNDLLDELFDGRPLSDWVLKEVRDRGSSRSGVYVDTYVGRYVYKLDDGELVLTCDAYATGDVEELERLRQADEDYDGPYPGIRYYNVDLQHFSKYKVGEEKSWWGFVTKTLTNTDEKYVFGVELAVKDAEYTAVVDGDYPDDVMPRCSEFFDPILRAFTSAAKKDRVMHYLKGLRPDELTELDPED